MTGINFFAREVNSKRLALLHELVPKAVRIAVLVNPGNATIAEATLRDVQEAARVIGLQIHVLKRARAARSMRSLPPSRASVPMPSSSRRTHSLTAAACNWAP